MKEQCFKKINKKITLHYLHFCTLAEESAKSATSAKQKKSYIMAHYVPAEEFKELTGALSKRKSTRRYCITRIKHVKDPITGEVVGKGPKEIYAQNRRDYKSSPLTPREQLQRARWREACREAGAIIRDKSHPR